jgi:hypothetical protein
VALTNDVVVDVVPSSDGTSLTLFFIIGNYFYPFVDGSLESSEEQTSPIRNRIRRSETLPPIICRSEGLLFNIYSFCL